MILVIARPDVLNALDVDTIDTLRKNMQEIYHDDKIRGVILTGEGEKANQQKDCKECGGRAEHRAKKHAAIY